MLLVPQSATHANNFNLNRSQAHVVAQFAFMAGVMGAATGLAAAHDEYLQENSYKDLTTWQKIKAFKWQYIVALCAAGAVGFGSLAYSSCVIDNAIDSYYNV